MIETVTFDYWQTLVEEPWGAMRAMQLDRWRSALAAAGHEVPRAGLEEAFDRSWAVFEERWRENVGPYLPSDATDLICDRLGIRSLDGLRAELVDAFRIAGELAPLDLANGAEECLRRLRKAGIRLGIVCDVGMTSAPTLRASLEGFGLLDAFDAWSFSDETGWFKPAREAFEPALAALGVSEPSLAAHVGDRKRTDVAGALALGMTAVRYTGFRDDPHEGPEAHHVIASLTDLPAVLGLG